MTRMAIALGTAVVVAFAGCTAAPETDKSGGEPRPVTLTLGTADHEDTPGGAQVMAYIQVVATLSDGRIEVEPRWEASGENADDWDQATARMVMSGDLDLGMIPARAWDTEGVDTFRALHAPFLVTSDKGLDQAVTAGLGVQMLAGLDEIGVTGLALLPESFRWLFVFGEPARSLADLRGRGVRAPWSATTYAVHEALGMVPDDPNGPLYTRAIADGDIQIAETAFGFAPEEPGAVIGNLPLFPKVNTLVANTDAWRQMTEPDKEILRQAAAAVQQEAIAVDLNTSELEQAKGYCQGGSVVTWEADEVGAAQAAVRPVYADLESDPVSSEFLSQLKSLVVERIESTVSVPQCSPDEPPAAAAGPAAPTGDQTVLDGTYRFTIPAEYLEERGASRHDVAINSGVLTVTLDGGDYRINWRSPEEPEIYDGTYTVDGQDATFHLSWIPTSASPQGLPWSVNWERRADGDLAFTVDMEREPLLDAIFIAAPWNRLG